VKSSRWRRRDSRGLIFSTLHPRPDLTADHVCFRGRTPSVWVGPHELHQVDRLAVLVGLLLESLHQPRVAQHLLAETRQDDRAQRDPRLLEPGTPRWACSWAPHTHRTDPYSGGWPLCPSLPCMAVLGGFRFEVGDHSSMAAEGAAARRLKTARLVGPTRHLIAGFVLAGQRRSLRLKGRVRACRLGPHGAATSGPSFTSCVETQQLATKRRVPGKKWFRHDN
jgi:hypothetical protein